MATEQGTVNQKYYIKKCLLSLQDLEKSCLTIKYLGIKKSLLKRILKLAKSLPKCMQSKFIQTYCWLKRIVPAQWSKGHID